MKTAGMTTLALGCLLGSLMTAALADQSSISPAATSTTTTSSTTVVTIPGSTLNVSDRLFLIRASEANQAEIQCAMLADKHAKSDRVKQLAKRMMEDHGNTNSEISGLAVIKGVTLPKGLGAIHQAVYDKLAKCYGSDFDKLYLSTQVEDHENVLALLQEESLQGQDADVKSLEARTLPAIADHTSMIYQLANSLQAPVMWDRPRELASGNTALYAHQQMPEATTPASGMSEEHITTSTTTTAPAK